MTPEPLSDRIGRIRRNALEALLHVQAENGSFPSLCSDNPRFVAAEEKSTVFPSALILSCLTQSDAPRKLIEKLTRFILDQRSETWSWNYFDRTSDDAKAHRYPDDLDDTACALIALEKTGRLRNEADILAHFAQNLIRTETKEGGPYRTWLVDNPSETWCDVDIAVNANVAYFLGTQGIFLDGLDAFLCEAIDRRHLPSLYYHAEIVTIYFLSRYVGLRQKSSTAIATAAKNLGAMALKELSAQNVEPLEISLAISALITLDQSNEINEKHIETVLQGVGENGLWAATPVYTEEIRQNMPWHCGSAALTTAFCIEALTLYEKSLRTTVQPMRSRADTAGEYILDVIKLRLWKLFDDRKDVFHKDLAMMVERFSKSGADNTICLFPYRFAEAADFRSYETVINLGLANLLGWIGYTIQDDAMDESENTGLIPLANICIRESLRLFQQHTPPYAGEYVRKILTRIDSANAQELALRNPSTLKRFRALSDDILAWKSSGHALGPLIILIHLDHGPTSPIFKAAESFFRHYLIARQMNDDAHDWQKDLGHGHLNSASSILLHLEPMAQNQEEIFWTRAIDIIVRKIQYRICSARKDIEACKNVVDPTYLESLLTPLERAAQKALSERDRAFWLIGRLES